jgi:hypothetical protein
MIPDIHVETPDGEVLKTTTGKGDTTQAGKGHTDTNDANDNAAGPKANPDPRANANISTDTNAGTNDRDEAGDDEGTGTEITDGEAG